MKKISFVVFTLIISIAALGCDAQKTTKTAADANWTAAYKDGKCTKSAGQDAYVACLEKSEELTRQHPPPKDGGDVISGAAPSQETGTQTTTTVKKEETTVSTQTSQPPQVTQLPPPPPFALPAASELPQMKFPSGGFIFVPVATGAYCQLPKSMKALQLDIANGSDYLLEVRGNVVPLNCDVGDKFVPAKVLRKGGKVEDTWVIRGDLGRVVFLPLNGGLGDVKVEVDAYMDLGDSAPAPAVGFAKHTFHVPASDGGHYVWDISASRLTGF